MKTMKKALLPALVALILAGPVSADFATPSGMSDGEIATSVTNANDVAVALAIPGATADDIGSAVGEAITKAAAGSDAVLALTTNYAVGKVLDSNPSEETVTATATNAVNAVVTKPAQLKTTVRAMHETAAGKAKPKDVRLLVKATVAASSGAATLSDLIGVIYESYADKKGNQEQALTGMVEAFGDFKGSTEEVAALKAKILAGLGLPAGKQASMAKRLDNARK